jgi:hypothetical protein
MLPSRISTQEHTAKLPATYHVSAWLLVSTAIPKTNIQINFRLCRGLWLTSWVSFEIKNWEFCLFVWAWLSSGIHSSPPIAAKFNNSLYNIRWRISAVLQSTDISELQIIYIFRLKEWTGSISLAASCCQSRMTWDPGDWGYTASPCMWQSLPTARTQLS